MKKLCFYTLSTLFAIALGLVTSAHGQDLTDPEFSFSFNLDSTTVTGDIFENAGTVTDLTLNPFTFTNNSNSISVPALEWTTNGGTDLGTLAIGAHSVILGGNGLPSTYDIGGTSYTPTGSSASFSITLENGGLTSFSAGYPYGTAYASSNPTFQAVATPEPSTWSLGLIALGGMFYLRRRALRS
jgi:hypothetical protein